MKISSKGDTVLHEMWHRIGNVEVNDYMKVIQYLKDKLNYVDHSRIAVKFPFILILVNN